MAKKKPTNKKQVIAFFPVYGLEMPSSGINKISINNVTFISSSRLRRTRKSLNIERSLNVYEAMYGQHMHEDHKLTDEAESFGFLHTRLDNYKHDFVKETQLFRDAFYILASSFLFKNGKRKHASMSMVGGGSTIKPIVALEKAGKGSWTRKNVSTFVCATDQMWKANVQKQYFNPIRKIADGHFDLSSGWRKTICRAAVLAGQSYLSRNLTQAFLYSFIALESLVVGHNDRFEVT